MNRSSELERKGFTIKQTTGHSVDQGRRGEGGCGRLNGDQGTAWPLADAVAVSLTLASIGRARPGAEDIWGAQTPRARRARPPPRPLRTRSTEVCWGSSWEPSTDLHTR